MPTCGLPKGFWNIPKHKEEFRERLLKSHPSLNVKFKDVKELGGHGLLRKYDWNLPLLLQSLFPERNIEVPIKKRIKPKNYWFEIHNQFEFVRIFERSMNFKSAEDWYQVTNRMIIKEGGERILKLNGGNVHKLLSQIYPQLDWKRNRAYNNWKMKLLKYQREYQIQREQDWYRISSNSIRKLLMKVHEHYHWKNLKISSKFKRATQHKVLLQFRNLYCNHHLIENYNHPLLVNNTQNPIHDQSNNFQYALQQGKTLELDLFLPSLNMAVEYHGEQHYYDIPSFGNWKIYQLRDETKAHMCKYFGIHLIIIPYWWDQRVESIRVNPL